MLTPEQRAAMAKQYEAQETLRQASLESDAAVAELAYQLEAAAHAAWLSTQEPRPPQPDGITFLEAARTQLAAQPTTTPAL